MKKTTLFIALFTVFILLNSGAQAADNTSSGNVGVLAGIATLNNSGGSPLEYGVTADYLFNPNWSVGVLFNTMTPASANIAGTTYSMGLSNLNLTVKYLWGNFDIGVLIGTNFYSTSVPGASSGSYITYGILGSYDFMLGGGFSLGPQLDYIGTGQSNGYSDFDAVAVVKYWF